MTVPAYPTEADWYRRWGQQTGGVADPATLAALGGAAADRLAWVFVSGYQAAVRYCFPEFPVAGWTCFAVAESDLSPGCTLQTVNGRTLLSGTKSWIAGAGCLNHLVVSVGQGDTMQFVAVDRTAPGVSVELPREPGFLAEMNQGVAHFDQVFISPDQQIQAPVRRHWFRAAEPLFILIALNACLAAQARHVEDQTRDARAHGVAEAAAAVVEQGKRLPALIERRGQIKAALADYRSQSAGVAHGFEQSVLAQTPDALQASWRNDSRLLAMFGVAAAG